MRVLVTGGAGFIGSHFAKRLQRSGDDIVVLDKLTYSGNPANLEIGVREVIVGERPVPGEKPCDPARIAVLHAGMLENAAALRGEPAMNAGLAIYFVPLPIHRFVDVTRHRQAPRG